MKTSFFGMKYFIMTILFVLAISTRFPYGGSPLTGDEATTFNHYAFQPWQNLIFGYEDPNQHSLFSILSNICLQVFGESELSFRLPSLFAGVVTIPLTYCVGLLLLNSRTTSFIAAILILFSEFHLMYSQSGRGYALTVFLALTLVSSLVILIDAQKFWLGTLCFFVSGWGLVITLPSNTVFLGSSFIFAVFFILEKRFSSYRFSFSIPFKRVAIHFVFLIFGVIYYLYPIREGLRSGAMIFLGTGEEHFNYAKPGWNSLLNIILPWSQPFGDWIYVFFILGILVFPNRIRMAALLTFLFLPPTIFFSLGVVGFPRTYIFWLPFIFYFSGSGIEWLLKIIRFKLKKCYPIFITTLIIFVLSTSVKFLFKYYSIRSKLKEPTIAEAQKISTYVAEYIPRNSLIVILTRLADEGDVLLHYMEDRIRNDMFRFISGETPEKLIFIAHRMTPPDKFKLGGYMANKFLSFPKNSFRKINCEGNICLYQWKVKFDRFIPPVFDPDYETKIPFGVMPETEVKVSKLFNILGTESINIIRITKQRVSLASKAVKSVMVKKDAYILLSYLKPYGHKSKVLLWKINEIEGPNEVGYLNPYMGRVTLANYKDHWQMVFALYPLKKGIYNLSEKFYLENLQNKFDGVQSFLITSQ